MSEAQAFGTVTERDADWVRESWRETVRSVLINEHRAFPANVLSVVLFAGAASFLPNASAYILPLLMRVLALVGAHLSYNHLRSRIENGAPLEPALRLLGVMLFFGGMSWAYLLLPSLDPSVDHPLRVLVAGGTLVGVPLIVTMTATLRIPTLAYVAGFLITLFAGVILGEPDAAFVYSVGVTLLAAGVLIFAFANVRQREASADMLVENRRLNEDLAEALAHAEFLAKHDPLTGLYNRRALFEQRLVESAHNDTAHMLLIDLDHFKKLNDTFGHDTGDRALIEASKLMRDVMRDYGPGYHFAARLGGEEFCLFIDEPDAAKALVFAEDLREAFSQLHEAVGLPAGALSASIGLTHHDRGETVDLSLQRADAEMYDAKTQGRNRVRRVER